MSSKFAKKRLLSFGVLFLVLILGGTLVIINRQKSSVSADITAGSWKASSEALSDGTISAPKSVISVTVKSTMENKSASQIVSIGEVQKFKKGYVRVPELKDGAKVYSLQLMSADKVSDKMDISIANTLFDPPPQNGEALYGISSQKESQDSYSFVSQPGVTSVRVVTKEGQVLDSRDIGGLVEQDNQPNFHSVNGDDLIKNDSTTRLENGLPKAEAASTDGKYVDIAFIGDDYTDLTVFHNDATRFASRYLAYEPFKSRAAQLNFHYIDNTADLGCYYDTVITRLLYCNVSTVLQAVNASGVPYDSVFVIVNSATYGGGGGTIGVGYNGSQGPEVSIHEFGHSFGQLDDEYNVYTSNGPVSNSIVYYNCYSGLPPAQSWEGLVARLDYAPGCEYPNYYRSSPGSIMLALNYYYFNAVSQIQLNKRIDAYAGVYLDAGIPTSQITSPTDGSAVTGTVNVTSTATDNVGIAWEELWIDNSLYRTDYTAPYAFSWAANTFSNGQHNLKVIAYDAKKNKGESPTITVTSSGNTDLTVPTVSISSPSVGAALSGLVMVKISASDNVGVIKTTLEDNGYEVGSDSSSPYEISWDTSKVANGNHILVAKAFDQAGNVGTSSAISVTIDNTVTSDIIAPSVSITYPVNGSTISKGSRIVITANASDNIGVTKVVFSANNSILCTDATAPFTCNWRASGIGRTKTASIKAVAYDAAGNTTTSVITITVK